MSRAVYDDKLRSSVIAMNRNTFAEHVITNEGDGRWLFAQPGTGVFHFRVIAAPRAVIVYGDIDDVIFVPSDRNALGWLRSVLRGRPGEYDLPYLAEKVRGRKDITEFQPELLQRWITEKREELERERRERMADLVDEDDVLNDESGGASPPEFEDDEELERIRDQLDALDSLNTDPGSADVAYGEIHDTVDDVDELPDLCGLTHTFMLQVFGLQCFCTQLDALEAKAVAP